MPLPRITHERPGGFRFWWRPLVAGMDVHEGRFYTGHTPRPAPHRVTWRSLWIPAFAGMTGEGGNDETRGHAWFDRLTTNGSFRRRAGAFLAVSLALVALLAGCGGEPEPPAPVYSGILAASEFVPGANRFPFGLVDRDGAFLEEAEVSVRFFELQGETSRFHAEAQAVWREVEGVTPHLHDDGELHLHLDYAGLYVVNEVSLSTAGVWGAEFVVADGTLTKGAVFQVQAEASAPMIGNAAPRTENLTIHDVASFAEVSTRQVEGDALHNVSVAGAIDAGEPFVVFFASPRFCVSALCGPVTDTLERVQQELGGGVEVIHIEPWDLDAARNEGRLTPSAEMVEWGLPSEPWTFVVDGGGRISARYEGLVTADEVLGAVRAAQG